MSSLGRVLRFERVCVKKCVKRHYFFLFWGLISVSQFAFKINVMINVLFCHEFAF